MEEHVSFLKLMLPAGVQTLACPVWLNFDIRLNKKGKSHINFMICSEAREETVFKLKLYRKLFSQFCCS